jgi:hypothetical protein
MVDVVREIEWFYKRGDDKLVGSEELNINVSVLKSKLDIGDDNDPNLYGHYLIPEVSVNRIQPFLKHKIDTARYDYYIITYAQN